MATRRGHRRSTRKSSKRRDPVPHRPKSRNGIMRDAYRLTPAFRPGGSKYKKTDWEIGFGL